MSTPGSTSGCLGGRLGLFPPFFHGGEPGVFFRRFLGSESLSAEPDSRLFPPDAVRKRRGILLHVPGTHRTESRLFPILHLASLPAFQSQPDWKAGKGPAFTESVEKILSVGIGDQVGIIDKKEELRRPERSLHLGHHLGGVEKLEAFS